MQIPKEFPQFKKEKFLVVVTGTHESRFIEAHDGKITELLDMRLEVPKYSDREGHFLRRAFGKVLGSGSVYDDTKNKEMKDFLRSFKKRIKKVIEATNPNKLILLAPDYAKKTIRENLPKKPPLTLTINGNFTKNSLEDILNKISEQTKDRSGVEPISEEARKILEKGE